MKTPTPPPPGRTYHAGSEGRPRRRLARCMCSPCRIRDRLALRSLRLADEGRRDAAGELWDFRLGLVCERQGASRIAAYLEKEQAAGTTFIPEAEAGPCP